MTEYADRPQQHAITAHTVKPAGQSAVGRTETLQRAAARLTERPEVKRQAGLASALSARNPAGLPPALQTGVETLSGIAMDDVRVHRNSSRPAQLQAHAFTQGRDIHVAPGQDRHLPHEAWHVVQQKQGRVKPTLQAKGIPINDDRGLEAEADRMGARAANLPIGRPTPQRRAADPSAPVQRVVRFEQIDLSLSAAPATREQVLNWLAQGGMRRVPGLEGAIDRLIDAPGETVARWYGQAAFMALAAKDIDPHDEADERQRNADARALLDARAAARAAAARHRFTELMAQFPFIVEQKGAYAELWQIYRQGGNPRIEQTMRSIERCYNEALDIRQAISAIAGAESAAAGPAELPGDLIGRIERLVLHMEAAPAALSRAEALLRADEKSGSGSAAERLGPEAILGRMRTADNQEEWDQTARKMAGVLRRGFVMGPAATIAKIDQLVAKYVGAWDAMGTDGLKGASIEAIRRLELIRVEIANAIANSGSIAMQISCGPGSQFFDYVMSLARQSCSSREVQNFKGWWAAHKREE